MKKNEHGFGITTLILILVIVGLVAAVGWLVYDRQNDKTLVTDSKNSKTQQQSVATKPEAKNTETSSQSSTSSLPVTQWGIKVGLRDANKLEYVYTSQPNGDYYGAAYDSTVEFKLKADQTVPKDCNRSVGTLFRSTQLPQSEDVYGVNPTANYKKVGNYYYYTSAGNLSCSSDSEHNALLDRVKQDLLNIQDS